MDDQSLPPGTVVNGYELLPVLGKGGFGITYAARHRNHARVVALKEFMPAAIGAYRTGTKISFQHIERTSLETSLAKFEATAHGLMAIEHPHVVRVLDFFRANGTAYLAMEMVQGRTLKALLDERGSLTPEGLRYVLEPVMDALAHVHAKGFVHRDIAPDNIMIREDGGPILIDFGGLSPRFDSELTRSGTIGIMKKHYTAPDQMSFKALPMPSSDIYSCAAVAYHALAGEPPEDGMERLTAAAVDPDGDAYVPLVSRNIPGVPDALARAIDAAMALKADRRPQSIDAMRLAMGWGTSDPAIPEREDWTLPADRSPIARPPRRRRAAMASVSVLALGLTAFAALDPYGIMPNWGGDAEQAADAATGTAPPEPPVGVPEIRDVETTVSPEPAPEPQPAPTPEPEPSVPPPAPDDGETVTAGLGDMGTAAAPAPQTVPEATEIDAEVEIDDGRFDVAVDLSIQPEPPTPLRSDNWPGVDIEAVAQAAALAVPQREPLTADELAFVRKVADRSFTDVGSWSYERASETLTALADAAGMLWRNGHESEAGVILNRITDAMSTLRDESDLVLDDDAIWVAYARHGDTSHPFWQKSRDDWFHNVFVQAAQVHLNAGRPRAYVSELAQLDNVHGPLLKELMALAQTLERRAVMRGSPEHEAAQHVVVRAIDAIYPDEDEFGYVTYEAAHVFRALPDWRPRSAEPGSRAEVTQREATWGRLARTDPDAAIHQANAISEPFSRSRALTAVAIGISHRGDQERARMVLDDIGSLRRRAEALVALASEQAAIREWEAASDTLEKAEVLTDEMPEQDRLAMQPQLMLGWAEARRPEQARRYLPEDGGNPSAAQVRVLPRLAAALR